MEVAAGIGIILALSGLLATLVIAVIQAGETRRQFETLSATLVDSLAISLTRFDRIDSATDLIRQRLQ